MAMYKATRSFKGILTMEAGETKELECNALIVKDLAKAGWIAKVEKLTKAKENDKK